MFVSHVGTLSRGKGERSPSTVVAGNRSRAELALELGDLFLVALLVCLVLLHRRGHCGLAYFNRSLGHTTSCV
jgi:hypothetical protein